MTQESIMSLCSTISLIVLLVYIISLFTSRGRLFSPIYIGHMYLLRSVIYLAIGTEFLFILISLALAAVWYFNYFVTKDKPTT